MCLIVWNWWLVKATACSVYGEDRAAELERVLNRWTLQAAEKEYHWLIPSASQQGENCLYTSSYPRNLPEYFLWAGFSHFLRLEQLALGETGRGGAGVEESIVLWALTTPRPAGAEARAVKERLLVFLSERWTDKVSQWCGSKQAFRKSSTTWSEVTVSSPANGITRSRIPVPHHIRTEILTHERKTLQESFCRCLKTTNS